MFSLKNLGSLWLWIPCWEAGQMALSSLVCSALAQKYQAATTNMGHPPLITVLLWLKYFLSGTWYLDCKNSMQVRSRLLYCLWSTKTLKKYNDKLFFRASKVRFYIFGLTWKKPWTAQKRLLRIHHVGYIVGYKDRKLSLGKQTFN